MQPPRNCSDAAHLSTLSGSSSHSVAVRSLTLGGGVQVLTLHQPVSNFSHILLPEQKLAFSIMIICVMSTEVLVGCSTMPEGASRVVFGGARVAPESFVLARILRPHDTTATAGIPPKVTCYLGHVMGVVDRLLVEPSVRRGCSQSANMELKPKRSLNGHIWYFFGTSFHSGTPTRPSGVYGRSPSPDAISGSVACFSYRASINGLIPPA